MAGTMTMLQVTAPSEYQILEVPIPTPGPGQVLMRVSAVTTCPQWDLHLRHNEPMFVGHRFEYPYTPGQPGHEATGMVEQVGAGVSELTVGDRVSAWRDAGHGRPGCYAQYVVHEVHDLFRVPGGPPDAALAPIELAMCVGTVFRMLSDMGAIRGTVFAVSGLGPAGLVACQMARAEGAATVVGFDPVRERREVAAQVGADECYDPASSDSDRFPARPNGPRIGASIDCVGARASAEFLMDRTADVVALFGVQREDFTFAVRHYSLRLCGYRGHSRESAEYAVGLIENGQLDLSSLVTHQLPLESYGEGIDLLERRAALKVCFLPWEKP